MADALIPGYSLPEHLKTAKQIIPIDIDRFITNNFFKTPQEALDFCQKPENSSLWQWDEHQIEKRKVLIQEYSLNANPSYFTFHMFDCFANSFYATCHYGVRHGNSATYKYELSNKPYGEQYQSMPNSNQVFYQYQPPDEGTSSSIINFASYNQSNGLLQPLLYFNYNSKNDPFYIFEISNQKITLSGLYPVIGHTYDISEPSPGTGVYMHMFYNTYHFVMQGIVSIF